MRGIEVYAINVMLRFFPSKILTFIQFMVLLMMISHDAKTVVQRIYLNKGFNTLILESINSILVKNVEVG